MFLSPHEKIKASNIFGLIYDEEITLQSLLQKPF